MKSLLGPESLLALFVLSMSLIANAQDRLSASTRISLAKLTPVSIAHVGRGGARLDENLRTATNAIGEVKFSTAVAVEINSRLAYPLEGRYSRFEAFVGISTGADAFYSGKPVVFSVMADTVTLFESGSLRLGDPSVRVSVKLDGRSLLTLIARGPVTEGTDNRHALWADAFLKPSKTPRKPMPDSATKLGWYETLTGTVPVAADGKRALMMTEIAGLNDFISSARFPPGSLMLLHRIGRGAAEDLEGDIRSVVGGAAVVGTAVRSSEHPVALRVYRVDKLVEERKR